MKPFGSMLLIASALWLSYSMRKKQNEHLLCLRECSILLSLILCELESRSSLIPELLECVLYRTSGCGSLFIAKLLEQMSQLGQIDFSELWHTAAETTLKEIGENALDTFCQAGQALGRYTLERQCEVLALCVRDLDRLSDTEQAAISRGQGMTWGLPLIFAVLLILLLI